jgi:signal transduction histidine kinase
MEGQSEFWDRIDAAVQATFDQLRQANSCLRQKIFDLHTIFEITRQLNSVLELENLLEIIPETCRQHVECESAGIVILPPGQEERLSLWHSPGTKPERNLSDIPVDSSLVQVLSRKNRPVLITELEQVLSASSVELALLKCLGVTLCLPLISKEKLLGVLVLGAKSSKKSYRPADLEFLSILSNSFAVAVENARLYQSVKSANQRVNQAQTKLAEKEKLAALGELAASLAHEINNPLGIVKNYVTLLKQEGQPTQSALEYTEIITEELNRVARIIHQLLTLYQPQHKEEFKPTEVAAVLNQSLDLLESDLQERKISLERKIAPEPLIIQARQEELRQVFLNLLMNSRDFTPGGGKIAVRLGQKNGVVQIEFNDSGVGLPEKDLGKLFTPFYTTKEKGKGTGLGLSICKRIIQDHQGVIEARNLERGGACFTVHLPLR